MKHYFTLTTCTFWVIAVAIVSYFFHSQFYSINSSTNSDNKLSHSIQPYHLGNTPEEKFNNYYAQPQKGPTKEQRDFAIWHQPFDAMLDVDMLQDMWDNVMKLPSETDLSENINTVWQCLGPYGMQVLGYYSHYSGRVLDLEIDVSSSLRVASASGGLWKFFLVFPVPLTDEITSQVIGTFATDPLDEDHILVGTGESYVQSGTGLWVTFDGGANWTQNTNITPTPSAFYRIRYTPGNPSRVHAMTDNGYFRSDDNGITWTQRLTGRTTDIAINTSNTNIMYTAIWGDGVYKTTDGGNNWIKLTSGGIPTINMGRTAISLCNSFPNYVYVCATKNDDNHTLGVFRSTNDGTTWQNITPPDEFHGTPNGQGGYDNTIGVHPVNPNFVFVGGVQLYRTTDGGTIWTGISGANVHADHHAILFNTDGSRVYNGNDGGISFSDDGGFTWNTVLNILPITQFRYIDVCENDPEGMIGGSQDNGICLTQDGIVWKISDIFWNGGDGGGVCIDPTDASRAWATLGVYGGNWPFERFRTTDSGLNWTAINNGIDPSSHWFPVIRTDRVNPVYLYTNSDGTVYKSIDNGGLWTKLNSTPFSARIYDVNVSKYSTGGAVVYASLISMETGNRLKVYDDGIWYERSATEFPSDVYINTVAQHPYNNNIAFALMHGISVVGPNQKIFKTIDRGITWSNITGDLPNVPLGDLMPHPTDNNKLFVGTEFGCFRTTDGGSHWERWNYGMPKANFVKDFSFIDSLSSNGKFYIVAGTYGRGIWIREISGIDPSAIEPVAQNTVKGFELFQNYPNPFNNSTVIKYSIPQEGLVTLKIYNTLGEEVTEIVNETKQTGNYEVSFDATGLPSGIYFFRLQTGPSVETKKMVLLR